MKKLSIYLIKQYAKKMKFNIFLFTLLFSKLAHSQLKKITVLDKFDYSVITNANLKFDDSLNYVTNEYGIVLVNDKKKGKFTISHVSYKLFRNDIATIKDTLFLEPKYYNLDEITLQNKKTQILKPKKALGNLNPRNYGTGSPLHENILYAIFIPNTIGKEFYINQIKLEPTGYIILDINGKTIEKFNNQKYAPFKLDIFNVNTTYNIPNQSILEKPIKVTLEKNEKFATAFFSEKLLIDKNGFFIVLSSFEKTFYEKNGFQSAPAFNAIQTNNNVNYLMLTKNNAIENSLWIQNNRNKDYKSVLNFAVQIEY